MQNYIIMGVILYGWFTFIGVSILFVYYDKEKTKTIMDDIKAHVWSTLNNNHLLYGFVMTLFSLFYLFFIAYVVGIIAMLLCIILCCIVLIHSFVFVKLPNEPSPLEAKLHATAV
jgi:fatty acid desaturase